MAEKKSEAKKTEGQGKASAFDNIIRMYPGYEAVLKSERHVYESFRKFPKRKELWQFIHLVECILSRFAVNYRSFDSLSAADECLNHIWEKRDSFVAGEEGYDFTAWLITCVTNYGKDLVKKNNEIVGFDSSDTSDEGGSIQLGYHGERNRLSEKGQFAAGFYQDDFLSAETRMELEEAYEEKTKAVHDAHMSQLRAEKKAFDKALNRVLSELRPQARLLYDLYNQEVSFNEIYLKINAGSPVAARVRRNELVKSMEKKMVKYWAAPRGYHYDDPLEPMRRLLMEITFFKGWSVNVTKQLRVK